MVEHGLNANHMMIAEFANNHKPDAKNIEEAIFKLHEKIEHLQAQIYDLQNQNCEYEYRFKRMSLAVDLRIPETQSSFYDVEPMPWKMGMGTPLGNCQAWRSAPVLCHHHTSIFTDFLSSILLVIS